MEALLTALIEALGIGASKLINAIVEGEIDSVNELSKNLPSDIAIEAKMQATLFLVRKEYAKTHALRIGLGSEKV